MEGREYGYIRMVDELGRVEIPREFLDDLGVTETDRALCIYHTVEEPHVFCIKKERQEPRL